MSTPIPWGHNYNLDDPVEDSFFESSDDPFFLSHVEGYMIRANKRKWAENEQAKKKRRKQRADRERHLTRMISDPTYHAYKPRPRPGWSWTHKTGWTQNPPTDNKWEADPSIFPVLPSSDTDSLEEESATDEEESVQTGPDYIATCDCPNNTSMVAERAMFQSSEVGDVLVPPNCTTIGAQAFADSTITKFASHCDRLTNFGTAAFARATKLSDVRLPKNTPSIPEHGFAHTSSLRHFTVPEHCTNIGSFAFLESGLVSFKTSGNVLVLQPSVFTRSIYLVECYLPDKLTIIPDMTFMGCTSLKTCEVPQMCHTIGKFAFRNTALRVFNSPTSNLLCTIGKGALANCKHLLAITLPPAIVKLEQYLIRGCESLVSVQFYHDRLHKKLGDQRLHLCTRVKIPEQFLLDAPNVKSITIPPFYTIHKQAFEHSSVNRLEIGPATNIDGMRPLPNLVVRRT